MHDLILCYLIFFCFFKTIAYLFLAINPVLHTINKINFLNVGANIEPKPSKCNLYNQCPHYQNIDLWKNALVKHFIVNDICK